MSSAGVEGPVPGQLVEQRGGHVDGDRGAGGVAEVDDAGDHVGPVRVGQQVGLVEVVVQHLPAQRGHLVRDPREPVQAAGQRGPAVRVRDAAQQRPQRGQVLDVPGHHRGVGRVREPGRGQPQPGQQLTDGAALGPGGRDPVQRDARAPAQQPHDPALAGVVGDRGAQLTPPVREDPGRGHGRVGPGHVTEQLGLEAEAGRGLGRVGDLEGPAAAVRGGQPERVVLLGGQPGGRREEAVPVAHHFLRLGLRHDVVSQRQCRVVVRRVAG